MVDNNCTDKTRQIAENLGCVVIEQKVQRLANTRNAGIRTCRNEWIALLDSDDVWDKRKIELQWQAIKKFPQAKIISCEFSTFMESTATSYPFLSINQNFQDAETGSFIDGDFGYFPVVTSNVTDYFVINASTTILHRDVFEKVGYFDESLDFAEEFEFFWRAMAAFPVAVVKKYLVTLLRHSANMSNDRKPLIEQTARVVNRMIRFPDNYPPGEGEKRMKMLRVVVANELREARKLPSGR